MIFVHFSLLRTKLNIKSNLFEMITWLKVNKYSNGFFSWRKEQVTGFSGVKKIHLFSLCLYVNYQYFARL